MDVWIPVIVAALTTLTAVLQAVGKAQYGRIIKVLVEAVEKWDDNELKYEIEEKSNDDLVGDSLAKIVSKLTDKKKPT